MTVSTGVIAQQPNTPLAAVSNEAKQYPVGSRLRLEYDFPAQPLNLPTGPSSATLATRGLAAATQAQAGLPDGFALLPGQTTIIAIQNPSASASARTPAATGAAANSSALMEKFITLQPIAYQGIPLSKGSDYTTVVGGDNRLLVVRRRGLPASVDATTPSVSALDAVAAARQVAGQAFTGLDPRWRSGWTTSRPGTSRGPSALAPDH